MWYQAIEKHEILLNFNLYYCAELCNNFCEMFSFEQFSALQRRVYGTKPTVSNHPVAHSHYTINRSTFSCILSHISVRWRSIEMDIGNFWTRNADEDNISNVNINSITIVRWSWKKNSFHQRNRSIHSKVNSVALKPFSFVYVYVHYSPHTIRVTLRIYVAFVFRWSINGAHTSYMRLPCHRAVAKVHWQYFCFGFPSASATDCWLIARGMKLQWNGVNVRNQNSFDILQPTYIPSMCCSHFRYFVLKIRHTTTAQYTRYHVRKSIVVVVVGGVVGNDSITSSSSASRLSLLAFIKNIFQVPQIVHVTFLLLHLRRK